MIKINGEFFDFSEIPLMHFLEEHGYSVNRIAVERNEEMVSKSTFESCVLRDGDVVEIVSFVGGGK
ncbi:MAG: sulfur carrier protein ThiS [Lachnospiraceae bacterium]|nr:sulfur carrier protein ThiS [Lachnospiraceae bacterium]